MRLTLNKTNVFYVNLVKLILIHAFWDIDSRLVLLIKALYIFMVVLASYEIIITNLWLWGPNGCFQQKLTIFYYICEWCHRKTLGENMIEDSKVSIPKFCYVFIFFHVSIVIDETYPNFCEYFDLFWNFLHLTPVWRTNWQCFLKHEIRYQK